LFALNMAHSCWHGNCPVQVSGRVAWQGCADCINLTLMKNKVLLHPSAQLVSAISLQLALDEGLEDFELRIRRQPVSAVEGEGSRAARFDEERAEDCAWKPMGSATRGAARALRLRTAAAPCLSYDC
jgi:hypothetical protein